MRHLSRWCGIASLAVLAWLAFASEPALARPPYSYGSVRTHPGYVYSPPRYSYYSARPHVGSYGAAYYRYPIGYPGYYTGNYYSPGYYRYQVGPLGGYYYYAPGPQYSFYHRY